MSKPRIVLGITLAGSVGFLMGLPERLTSEGWDVHLVTSPGKETNTYEASSITVHHVPMERQPALAADIRALFSWVCLLNELKPDMVVVGTPKASFLGIISAWITRVPTRVYHVRGLRLESTRHLQRLILTQMEKLTCTLATDALAVSDSLRRLMIDLKLINSHRISVAGYGSSNGVDIQRFTPGTAPSALRSELALAPEIPVIGFVGRITADKGSRELMEASAILEKQGIQHQLLIVGPKENEEEFEHLFGRHFEHPPVFTGRVQDTAPYYKLMSILCLPTYREGFPNVVLEAGASGIPVVTTNATGAVDSVVEGRTGRKVTAGSSTELASALKDLLVDESLRARLGRMGRTMVMNKFERNKVQGTIVEYLTQLLQRQNARK